MFIVWYEPQPPKNTTCFLAAWGIVTQAARRKEKREELPPGYEVIEETGGYTTTSPGLVMRTGKETKYLGERRVWIDTKYFLIFPDGRRQKFKSKAAAYGRAWYVHHARERKKLIAQITDWKMRKIVLARPW
jgi:hypothetical protein